jgi:hypothetical protein
VGPERTLSRGLHSALVPEQADTQLAGDEQIPHDPPRPGVAHDPQESHVIRKKVRRRLLSYRSLERLFQRH